MIPNIVYDLGLTPYEFTLYSHLVRTAGQKGACWKSNAVLVKETGIKLSTLKTTKKYLSTPRKKLNGKSLITITERKNKKHGGNETSLITIEDLWPDNYLHTKELQEISTSKGGGHHKTDPQPANNRPPVSSCPQRRTLEEDTLKKTTAKLQASSVVHKSITPDSPLTEQQQPLLISRLEEKLSTADVNRALDLLNSYTPKRIQGINDIPSYLINAVKNNYDREAKVMGEHYVSKNIEDAEKIQHYFDTLAGNNLPKVFKTKDYIEFSNGSWSQNISLLLSRSQFKTLVKNLLSKIGIWNDLSPVIFQG
jgi:hypothetical protein